MSASRHYSLIDSLPLSEECELSRVSNGQMGGITTEEDLSQYIILSEHEKKGIRQCRDVMPMKITDHYASLLDPIDPNDPLRRIVIPSVDELIEYPDDRTVDTHKDEADYQVMDGLIHRYPGKALLIFTTACFAHCRFCFRSEKIIRSMQGSQLESVLAYIRRDTSIRDVIFSGGDPLSADLSVLEYALSEVRKMDHVQIIRITTHALIYSPQIFNDHLIEMLKKYKPLYLLVSFIHPRELTEETCKILDRLSDAGIVLLQQGPILKGINNDFAILRELYEKLARHRTIPYYAIWGILGPGIRHFAVAGCEARDLMRQLENKTSGFCVPHLSTLDQQNNKTRSMGI